MKYGSILGLILLLTPGLGFGQVGNTSAQAAKRTTHGQPSETTTSKKGQPFIVKGPFQTAMVPARKEDYPAFQNPEYLTFQFQPSTVSCGRSGVNLQQGQASWFARGMKPTEPNTVRIPFDANDDDAVEYLKVRFVRDNIYGFSATNAGSCILSPPFRLGNEARQVIDAKKKKASERTVTTPPVPGQTVEINSQPLPPRENTHP